MHELRLRLNTNAPDARQDVIPFPGRGSWPTARRSPFESVRMAERALGRVERAMNDLNDLVEPIRLDTEFFSFDDHDDFPPAA